MKTFRVELDTWVSVEDVQKALNVVNYGEPLPLSAVQEITEETITPRIFLAGMAMQAIMMNNELRHAAYKVAESAGIKASRIISNSACTQADCLIDELKKQGDIE